MGGFPGAMHVKKRISNDGRRRRRRPDWSNDEYPQPEDRRSGDPAVIGYLRTAHSGLDGS